MSYPLQKRDLDWLPHQFLRHSSSKSDLVHHLSHTNVSSASSSDHIGDVEQRVDTTAHGLERDNDSGQEESVFTGDETTLSPHTMPQYTSRDVGDPTQIRKNKQSMADLKLRRLTELNNRLREDLERERIPVSQASKSIIAYCNSTRDYMVPSVWGVVPRGEDPYAPQQSGGCCMIM